jgi:Rrf2 family protein
MRLSSKTRYAARTLARLASAQGTDALSARQLAECRDLSVKYPEHILRGLNSAGFVRAVCGTCGGYALAKPSERLTLKDLLEAFQEPLAPVECVSPLT